MQGDSTEVVVVLAVAVEAELVVAVEAVVDRVEGELPKPDLAPMPKLVSMTGRTPW